MVDLLLNPTLITEEKANEKRDIDEIIRYLKKDFPIRTIKEELEKELTSRAEKLIRSPNEFDNKYKELKKTLQNECGDQNVRNWMGGKFNTISRENAIKAAFALRMSYKEADWFLMQSCWHDGFYMRDYKDVIYRYCLDKQMTYGQAGEMIKANSYLEELSSDVTNMFVRESVTEFFDKSLKKISTDEELNDLIKQNRAYFGAFRRKAYKKFKELYNTLKEETVSPFRRPDNSLENAKDAITDEEICGIMSMGVPNLKGKASVLNGVLKKIAEDTLSRTTLSEIISGKPSERQGTRNGQFTQVKRRHLLALWLIVYGSYRTSDKNTDKESEFRECLTIINDDLLEPCKMPLLDYRNPFDWVILNALHYSYFSEDKGDDEDSDVIERIEVIISQLFERTGDE